MGKRLTISNRWREWAKKEPMWAYTALSCFSLAMIGFVVHLGVLGGFWRSLGLWVLIAFDGALILITGFRKQWWWLTFWIYMTLGVIVWEIASYFFGSQL